MKEIPTEDQVKDFWNNIWGNKTGHNENGKWIEDLEKEIVDIPEQEWSDITIEEIAKAPRKVHKWKSPGLDQLNKKGAKRAHMAVKTNYCNLQF